MQVNIDSMRCLLMNEILKLSDVVWLNGMPRSGTTWLSQVFASAKDVRLKFCPLFSYEFKNMLDENSSTEQWQWLFNQTFHTSSDYLDQNYLRKQGLVPEFEQLLEPSHLVIKTTRFHHLTPIILHLNANVRVVHLVRDPRASIASWLSNPYEFPAEADPAQQWRSGACRKNGVGEFWGFDDWKMVTRQALQLSETFPDRFMLVSYDQLMKNVCGGVRQVFDFCQLTFDQQTADFIAQSHSRHDENKRSVFKRPDKIAQWRQLLDPSIIDAINSEIIGTELECFLYDT